MPIDFPANPTNGQVYANYIYDSSITAWRNVNTDTGIGTLNAMGLKNVVPTSIAVGSGSATVNSNGAVTLTNATAISVNGCFNSTYKNYRIILSGLTIGTSGGNILIQLKSDSSVYTDANYYVAGKWNASGGTSGQQAAAASTSWSLWYTDISNDCDYAIMDIINPYETKVTNNRYSTSVYQSGTVFVEYSGNGMHFNSVSATGFKISASSTGTFSGTVQVFGYTN